MSHATRMQLKIRVALKVIVEKQVIKIKITWHHRIGTHATKVQRISPNINDS